MNEQDKPTDVGAQKAGGLALFSIFGPIIGWLAAAGSKMAAAAGFVAAAFGKVVNAYRATMDYTYGFRLALRVWADRIGHAITDMMSRRWPDEAPVFSKWSRMLGYAIMAIVLWVVLAVAGHLIFPDKSRHVQGLMVHYSERAALLSLWPSSTKPAERSAAQEPTTPSIPMEPAGSRPTTITAIPHHSEPPAAVRPPVTIEVVPETPLSLQDTPPAPPAATPTVDKHATAPAPRRQKPKTKQSKAKSPELSPLDQLVRDITFGYLP